MHIVGLVTQIVGKVRKGKCAADLICMNQHHESVSLAAGIFLIN